MFVCLQICLFFLDLLVFIRIMKVFLEVFVYIRMVIFFINMFVHIWIIEYFIIMLVFLRNYQVLVNWLVVSQVVDLFDCFETKLSSVSLRFCWFGGLFVCLRTVFLDLVGAESNIFVGFAVVGTKVEFDKVVIFVWHLWLFVHVFVSMSDNFTISKLVQIGSLM